MGKYAIYIGDHVAVGKYDGNVYVYHTEGICVCLKKGYVQVKLKNGEINWYPAEDVDLY